MPSVACQVDRPLAVASLGVHLRAALAEQPHHLCRPDEGGVVERLLGVAGHRVDLRPPIEEEVDDVRMPGAGSPMYGPLAGERVLLDARPPVQQQLHGVVGPGSARVVQRVPTVGDLLDVELSPGLDQHDADVPMVAPDCQVQHPLALRPERRVHVDAALRETEAQQRGNHIRVTIFDCFLKLNIHCGLLHHRALFHGPLVLDKVFELFGLRQLFLDVSDRQRA
mmetsp:Transcript_102923/g.291494  ORF Transcript_102923/g.291494 Transcript_102923/m.291494 type:complete len:224 (+) Transcript_102923:395-1066(+)